MELNYSFNLDQTNNWFGYDSVNYQPIYECSSYSLAHYSAPFSSTKDIPDSSFSNQLVQSEPNVQYYNEGHFNQKDNGYQVAYSVSSSPTSFYPSSAEQSPSSCESYINDFDIDDLDEIINTVQPLDDQLIDILDYAGCSDLLEEEEEGECLYTSSSDSSTPKRKYSITSSSDSSDSFQPSPIQRKRGVRKSKRTHEERLERKKNQNKKAASKYRSKKKIEQDSHEQTLEELEEIQLKHKDDLRKIQTEFNVILPLAKAAFGHDPIRSELLSQLLARIDKHHLLE